MELNPNTDRKTLGSPSGTFAAQRSTRGNVPQIQVCSGPDQRRVGRVASGSTQTRVPLFVTLLKSSLTFKNQHVTHDL